MTQTAAFLAHQLEQTVPGPMWHGSALGELLADVTAAEARAHPIADAHSIAELVAHLTAWTEICARRLAGDTSEATSAEDWPVADASSDERWRDMVRTLGARYGRIARATQALAEKTLAATLPARTHTAADMLNGLVVHGAYHGGQIALLKKALRSTGRVAAIVAAALCLSRPAGAQSSAPYRAAADRLIDAATKDSAAGVPGAGLEVDGTRYFWLHHTNADTPDKLDPRDVAR